MRLTHPTFPDIHVEVAAADVELWLAQGWLKPPAADGDAPKPTPPKEPKHG